MTLESSGSCAAEILELMFLHWYFCIFLLDTVVFNTYHVLESYQHLSKLTRGRGMGQGVKNLLFNGLTMNHEQVHPEMVRILCVFYCLVRSIL